MSCLNPSSSRSARVALGVLSGMLLVPFIVGPAAAVERADRTPTTVRASQGNTTSDGIDVTELSLSVGASPVRVELDEPAQMAVLTGIEPGSEFAMRSSNGGRWGEWVEIETEDDRPDGAPGEEGSAGDAPGIGPVWLGGDADRVEIRQLGGTPQSVDVELLDVRADDPVPVEAAKPGHANLRAGTGAAVASNPFIAARSSWATSDMTWQSQSAGCGSKPTINSQIKAMVVHHTAGTSSYGPDDVPGIIRGTWYYHAQTKGWCDIAYNFVVDRFGRLWEGRQGGVDKLVRGGHTYGHNTETQGIVQLGHFDQASSPAAMNDATARLIGWKLGRHGVDPKGRTYLTNHSSSTTSKGLAPGKSIGVPTVIGHRDLGSTSCPGANTYAQMPRIRDGAQRAAHATALFRTFLTAVPDSGPAGPYVTMASTSGLATVTHELAHSSHYAGGVVDDLYRSALGRSADPAGRAYWISVLRNGATVQQMGTSFYGSEEFYRRNGDTPETFVDALYRELLHRDADDAGRRYWATQLHLGMAAPPDVAHGFYASIESRRDRVTQVYRKILGRTPDAAGRDYWAEEIQRSGDLTLATFLAVSEEYYRVNLR